MTMNWPTYTAEIDGSKLIAGWVTNQTYYFYWERDSLMSLQNDGTYKKMQISGVKRPRIRKGIDSDYVAIPPEQVDAIQKMITSGRKSYTGKFIAYDMFTNPSPSTVSTKIRDNKLYIRVTSVHKILILHSGDRDKIMNEPNMISTGDDTFKYVSQISFPVHHFSEVVNSVKEWRDSLKDYKKQKFGKPIVSKL